MNILAHIYLSNNQPALQIGNFIADFIIGNQYKHLPLAIQQGIFLHRQIDTFTDAHPIVKQSKHRLNERYGLYNGIIIDIFYDHFLAKNWADYHAQSLSTFSADFYTLLNKNQDLLPLKVLKIMPYLINQNWLLNYAQLAGIEQTLIGMNNRTHLQSHMHLAIADLKLYYNDFESDFRAFFKNLITFSAEKIEQFNVK
ncbi:MAG: DUF479 domain-containing protein [Flavobacteriales bacterium CG03_land_8_20_14_0_80_35_15]|nr:MAG: ACP phosphodiesterase [Flavobacteriales bacterium CG11_big_fil_rev_8_21_14_0_20_35_7]PIV17156.1 MAG: DUF479 domain-containing protein [Flavobacteriales bacterium CG03_land_8_20_14_0_80_35_15]